MSSLFVEHSLATKKRKSPSVTPLSAKLPADVVESARIVAAFRNQSMADLLGDILRPILKKMEKDEITKRAKNDGDH
jgi:hypothetical protein